MPHQWIDSFWSSAYAPHGYCLLWRRDLIVTHLVSDILIALAYFSIPFALIKLVRRRPDVQFSGMFWLFALFIFACGTTHVMAAWNLWHGHYGLEGVIKAITAAASVPTAYMLWKLLPRAMIIPSTAQLAAANDQLSAMVMERDRAVERLNQEIVERERAEHALVQMQKIDAIGQLTGGIAHDFNNLLQAIDGNLELIGRSPDRADKVARWAGNARQAVDRGSRLASQLLVFARVQQLEPTSVHVNQVIQGMDELLDRSVGPQVEVTLDLTEEPTTVHSEPTQLEMALLNLAINARDAIAGGNGKLTISTSRASGDELPASLEPGSYVRISVVDNGTGMSPEVAGRAIDPFFTTKEVGKGTGLGLSMAYGFARQSGGSLEITSEEGVGTRIDIYLPAVEAVAGEPLDAASETTGGSNFDMAGPRSGRITIVDDDDGVRTIMADMLSANGFDVESFASPQEALEKADWAASSVVVLDLVMPGLTGAELAERIRAEHPDKRIVFVTGFAGSTSLDSLKGANNKVLRKPFTNAELLAAVDSLATENG